MSDGQHRQQKHRTGQRNAEKEISIQGVPCSSYLLILCATATTTTARQNYTGKTHSMNPFSINYKQFLRVLSTQTILSFLKALSAQTILIQRGVVSSFYLSCFSSHKKRTVLPYGGAVAEQICICREGKRLCPLCTKTLAAFTRY